jgi:ABC-type sugar transport system ATPase subunit
MTQVILEHVTKTYPGGVTAVRDLTLTVAAGERLVLVGPSGCGKTTTLRLIAGLESPTYGMIHLGGRPANGLPPWRRDVAVAFQRPALYPHRTVRANLGFGLALSQTGGWLPAFLRDLFHPQIRQDRAGRVAAVARLLGLEDVLDRLPAQLSGGQQQRVALGRALVRRPGLFLLDEPLSNLDVRQRTELRRELLLLRQHFPATMLYVTHDPAEALTLGDRVAVLRGGVLEQVGPPLEVCRRPVNRFVAAFLAWPPLSFLDGEIQAEAFVGTGGRLPLPAEKNGWAAFAGRAATLGIRAEDIQLGMASGRATLEMEVSLVELLGRSCLATCTRTGWQLAALAEAPGPHEGQRVMVTLNLHSALLFDRQSGRTLDAYDRTG